MTNPREIEERGDERGAVEQKSRGGEEGSEMGEKIRAGVSNDFASLINFNRHRVDRVRCFSHSVGPN